MHEEITASYLFTTEAMMPALRWHQRKLFGMLWMVAAGVIFVFTVVGLYQSGFQTKDLIMTAVLIPLTLVGLWLWLFLMKLVLRFIQSRNLKSIPGYGNTISWTVTHEALQSSLASAKSTIPWSQVYKTIETPDGALIYLQKMLFNWLPKTAFNSEGDYGRFLELLTDRTRHSKIR